MQMETIWIAILGALQGATEFLPVSSSGHLAVGQMVIADLGSGESLAEKPLTLEILLHLATLLSVVVFFRLEILDAIRGGVRALGSLARGQFTSVIREDDGANTAMAVVIGTVPTGILGIALRDMAEVFSRSSLALGFSFIGCACLLLASRWWKGGEKRLSWRSALVIGLVQGIAVLPGISRSGVTIAVGLAIGLRREEAARFSFLLALPAIVGAAVLELDATALTAGGMLLPYTIGALTAFAVGFAALYLLVHIVRKGRFWLFAPYVGAVGVYTLLFF